MTVERAKALLVMYDCYGYWEDVEMKKIALMKWKLIRKGRYELQGITTETLKLWRN